MGLDPDLAVAIATVESAGYPLAVRYEPGWAYFYQPEIFARKNGISEATERMLQASSWGVMQVMGTVCRELGHQDSIVQIVARPELGISFGLKKIKKLCERYESEEAVIASYNAGSPRKMPGGKYKNQQYVDKVLASLRRLRAIG